MNLRFFMFTILLNISYSKAAMYIAEVINNTNMPLYLAYPHPVNIKILSCATLKNNEVSHVTKGKNPHETSFIVNPKSRALLEGAYIPMALKENHANGIYLGLGTSLNNLRNSSSRSFALIRQRNNWIEKIDNVNFRYMDCNQYFKRISIDTRLSHDQSNDELYTLVVNQLSEQMLFRSATNLSVISNAVEVIAKKYESLDAEKKADFVDSKKDSIEVASYSITILPETFFVVSDNRSVLNNKGQIAGYIKLNNNSQSANQHKINQPFGQAGQQLFNDNSNCTAAVWDPKTGIQSCKLDHSRATNLDDNGFVAVSHSKSSIAANIVVWDLKTDELQFGPNGYPRAMNNTNVVLADNGIAWDFICNNSNVIVHGSNGFPPIGISDQNSVCPWLSGSLYGINLNKKGNALVCTYQNPSDLFLKFTSEGLRPIRLPQKIYINSKRMRTALSTVNALLNDNDEVIVKVWTNETSYGIAKWRKNNQQNIVINVLQDIPELRPYNDFEIIGFNNIGQIAIRANNSGNAARILILTPKV